VAETSHSCVARTNSAENATRQSRAHPRRTQRGKQRPRTQLRVALAQRPEEVEVGEEEEWEEEEEEEEEEWEQGAWSESSTGELRFLHLRRLAHLFLDPSGWWVHRPPRPLIFALAAATGEAVPLQSLEASPRVPRVARRMPLQGWPHAWQLPTCDRPWASSRLRAEPRSPVVWERPQHGRSRKQEHLTVWK
jgi:hypothetical protein